MSGGGAVVVGGSYVATEGNANIGGGITAGYVGTLIQPCAG
jgi:hypothetical protein